MMVFALEVLIVSWVVGIVGTRISIGLARTFLITDRPGGIKIHTSEMPRFGGVGVILGVFLTMAGWSLSNKTQTDETIVLLAVCLPTICAGAIDDLRGLSPRYKLLGQAMSSLLAGILLGDGFSAVSFSFSIVRSLISMPFLCFMSNGINLLDGMDGLAAGVTSIASFSFVALALMSANHELALLPLSVSGACLGFLLLNLPPAKTFMGDIGSLFLGFVLGVVALQILFVDGISVARTMGILLILLIPIADTSMAFTRRISHHKDFSAGDRLHIYDCLCSRLGNDTWKTLASMWLLSATTSIAGVAAFFSSTTVAVALAMAGVLLIGLLGLRIGAMGSIPSIRDFSV